MSLFSSVRERAAADLESAWTKIKGFFSADIEPALKTFFQVIESNGGSDLLKIALSVIASAESGAGFGALIALATSQATAAGIQTTELAVKSALQVAQSSLQTTLASEGVAPLTTIPAAPGYTVSGSPAPTPAPTPAPSTVAVADLAPTPAAPISVPTPAPTAAPDGGASA